MPEMYRQGDVLLMKVGEMPKGARQQKQEGRVVLAWGETTGHAHAIDAKLADMYQVTGADSYIVAKPGAALVHEEHSTIKLDPGIYRIVHQREYAPDAIRFVID